MRSIAISAALCLLSGSIFTLRAQEFFCTDAPRRTLTYGVRAGLNLSNVTVADGTFDRWNVNSWGMGMQVGAEVGVHFRDFFSVRPGFYFESRSGDYAYDMTVADDVEGGLPVSTGSMVQLGHYRTYHFTIPLMAVVSFNISEGMRWHVMAGPYVSFRVGAGGSDKIMVPAEEGVLPVVPSSGAAVEDNGLYTASRRGVNGGFKLGTGLQWRHRWSLDVAYLAACGHAWKSGLPGGRDKTWSFTLGYDF